MQKQAVQDLQQEILKIKDHQKRKGKKTCTSSAKEEVRLSRLVHNL